MRHGKSGTGYGNLLVAAAAALLLSSCELLSGPGEEPRLERLPRDLSAAEQAARTVAARLKQALEQENANGMRQVHAYYDVGVWDAFFRIAENVRASVEIKSLEMQGNSAIVDVGTRIQFRNTSKRAEESTDVDHVWTLEQRGGTWVLVSVTAQ